MITLNDYYKKKYGQKVYKLALQGGETCPNRDGKCGSRGCIFCSEDGSGDFCPPSSISIHEQIELAKAKLQGKAKSGKFIAYFQSFTATYLPIKKLEEKLQGALSHPDIVGISIATRPDCLPDDVLDLLKKVNKIKPLCVELGLQTIHPETARFIRRGWELPVFDKAVADLKQRGIEVVAHIIIGLPKESKDDILQTVDYISTRVDGVKLQLLHILKGTDLATLYEKGEIDVFSKEEYIDILAECVGRLPPQMVVHRLTGDGPKKLLLAPLWSGDKKGVLNAINKRLKEENII